MSDYRVLQDLSLHLRGLLESGFSALPASPIVDVNEISLLSPPQVRDFAPEPDSIKLSLYLYHVEPNGQLNNERFFKIGDVQYAPPFYVDAHYLLTPVTKSATDDLLILGRVIDILGANGILRAPFLRLDYQPSAGEVRMRMLNYDLENVTKIWSAFSLPFRMCVAYEVTGIPIESLRLPLNGPPVEEALLDVQQMNSR